MPITLLSSWCLHAERDQRLETTWRGLGEGVEGLRVSMDALVFDYWEHLPVCVLNALLGTHWSTGICQYQTLLTDIVLRWHLPMSVVMGISITYCYTNSEFNHGCMHVYYCYITRRWRDKQQAGRTDRDRHANTGTNICDLVTCGAFLWKICQILTLGVNIYMTWYVYINRED